MTCPSSRFVEEIHNRLGIPDLPSFDVSDSLHRSGLRPSSNNNLSNPHFSPELLGDQCTGRCTTSILKKYNIFGLERLRLEVDEITMTIDRDMVGEMRRIQVIARDRSEIVRTNRVRAVQVIL